MQRINSVAKALGDEAAAEIRQLLVDNLELLVVYLGGSPSLRGQRGDAGGGLRGGVGRHAEHHNGRRRTRGGGEGGAGEAVDDADGDERAARDACVRGVSGECDDRGRRREEMSRSDSWQCIRGTAWCMASYWDHVLRILRMENEVLTFDLLRNAGLMRMVVEELGIPGKKPHGYTGHLGIIAEAIQSIHAMCCEETLFSVGNNEDGIEVSKDEWESFYASIHACSM